MPFAVGWEYRFPRIYPQDIYTMSEAFSSVYLHALKLIFHAVARDYLRPLDVVQKFIFALFADCTALVQCVQSFKCFVKLLRLCLILGALVGIHATLTRKIEVVFQKSPAWQIAQLTDDFPIVICFSELFVLLVGEHASKNLFNVQSDCAILFFHTLLFIQFSHAVHERL